MKNSIILLSVTLCLCFLPSLKAQMSPKVYKSIEENNGETIVHELKMSSEYLIYSIYGSNPAVFIKTLGGFYTVTDNTLYVKLEFNSDYGKDAVRELKIPYSSKDGHLTLQFPDTLKFAPSKEIRQDLDGQWLFATRGPDTGQERRGEESSRKTLKFLMDGHFQWIAYDVGTMAFSGTGGGTFTSKDGVYTENIKYFSKDNSRVGASLSFAYELKGKDWHHSGKNSMGEPLYEIWGKRL